MSERPPELGVTDEQFPHGLPTEVHAGVREALERLGLQSDDDLPDGAFGTVQEDLEAYRRLLSIDDPDDRATAFDALQAELIEAFGAEESDLQGSKYLAERYPDVEEREEAIRIILKDQQASLNQWVEYLASEGTPYPLWTDYWIARSVFKMSTFDKKKGEFRDRSNTTIAPFPDLNPAAVDLAVAWINNPDPQEMLDAWNEWGEGDFPFADIGQKVDRKSKDVKKFFKVLETQSFADYYAFALTFLEKTELAAEVVSKEYRVYVAGDGDKLAKDAQGHGSGWCITAPHRAASELKNGYIEVLYTQNAKARKKERSMPRFAVLYDQDQDDPETLNLVELRGVGHKQNLDRYIAEELLAHLETQKAKATAGPIQVTKDTSFKVNPDSFDDYIAGARSVVRFWELSDKHDAERAGTLDETGASTQLTPEELRFLWEVGDEEIFSFALREHPDPRVDEMRLSRDFVADMRVVLDLEDESVTHTDLVEKLLVHGNVELLITYLNKLNDDTIEHHELLLRICEEYPDARERVLENIFKFNIDGAAVEDVIAGLVALEAGTHTESEEETYQYDLDPTYSKLIARLGKRPNAEITMGLAEHLIVQGNTSALMTLWFDYGSELFKHLKETEVEEGVSGQEALFGLIMRDTTGDAIEALIQNRRAVDDLERKHADQQQAIFEQLQAYGRWDVIDLGVTKRLFTTIIDLTFVGKLIDRGHLKGTLSILELPSQFEKIGGEKRMAIVKLLAEKEQREFIKKTILGPDAPLNLQDEDFRKEVQAYLDE